MKLKKKFDGFGMLFAWLSLQRLSFVQSLLSLLLELFFLFFFRRSLLTLNVLDFLFCFDFCFHFIESGIVHSGHIWSIGRQSTERHVPLINFVFVYQHSIIDAAVLSKSSMRIASYLQSSSCKQHALCKFACQYGSHHAC